jgi:glucose/arabinose dehydrogenase
MEEMKNMKNRIFWGLLSGIVGGLAGAMVLWGSWLLPTLGLLLTRADIINGATTLLVFGAVGGILYALILGGRKLRLATTILAGLLLGVIFWVLGGLVLIPVLLGFPPQLSNPLDHWTPLVAFSIYGIIVSLLYSRWALRQPVLRTYIALGLLLFSIVLTPLMLRAAVSTEPEALEVPEGYRAEVVAKGFTFPTSLLVDQEGNVYVAEAGYAYGPKTTLARVLMVRQNGGIEEVARDFEGPINGLAMQENKLFVSHKGKITEVDLKSKERKDLIKDLPSLGDHQNNDLIIGKDGNLYFGQGTATNAGVVGPDNFVYAWADRYPKFHDYPSRNYILTGENYEAQDLSVPGSTSTKTTGAFAPFGQKREKGEQLDKTVPANGAIHCLELESGELSIYADGLRNPYGLAQDEEGKIYATNLGYDDRGVRAVKGSPDWIVEIKKGAWYGWPDYAGTVPLTDERFASDRGINLKPLIDNPLEVEAPLVELPPHYSPMKLDYAPEGFKLAGLFVAIFGDGQPLTEDLEKQVPTGVMRVDPESGDYEWFIKNKEKPRAGRLGDGLKRVTAVRFDQEGSCLYVLDFGVMEFTDFAPNAIPRTGVLWKIKRDEQPVQPGENRPGKETEEKKEKPEGPPVESPKEEPLNPQPNNNEKPGETPSELPPTEEPVEKPDPNTKPKPEPPMDQEQPKPGVEKPTEPSVPENPGEPGHSE